MSTKISSKKIGFIQEFRNIKNKDLGSGSDNDLEVIKKHEEYKGTRIKRGLFKSGNGFLINSDVNGSLNILRKKSFQEKY